VLQTVKKYIKANNLLQKGDVVLAAVSGGRDSMTLLYVLANLAPQMDFSLVVGHVNHNLRGEESNGDAAFVKAECKKLAVPFYSTNINVKAELIANGGNLQNVARKMRYDWLKETATAINANLIATAHHANDQAETVLMHLLRGAGSQGLAAMSPKENGIIRPFLAITREQIDKYCAENQINWREDSSNTKTGYLRNRLRLELWPLLKKYNPQLEKTLLNTSILSREDSICLDALARQHMIDLLKPAPGGYNIDMADFTALPTALAKRVVRLAAQELVPKTQPEFEHIQRVMKIKEREEIALPGRLYAFRQKQVLYIGSKRLPILLDENFH